MNTSLSITNVTNLQFLFGLLIHEFNNSPVPYINKDSDRIPNHTISIGQVSIKNGFLVLEEPGRKELRAIFNKTK